MLDNTLASLCSWAGQFEFYLVAAFEDRFSCDMAQIIIKFSLREFTRNMSAWIYAFIAHAALAQMNPNVSAGCFLIYILIFVV